MGAITEDELMGKARELGTVEAAIKWMKSQGLTLAPNPIPPAGTGRSSVPQQGALDAAAEEDEVATDEAEDTSALGGLDLAALDFGQIKKDPGAFFKSLLTANQAAEDRAAQSAKQLYDQGRQQILAKYAGPKRSEQLFALSRAMLAPREVRGFGGFLGNVTGALSENEKAMRTAEQAREEKLFELQQQYQQGEAARAAARPKTAADLAAKYLAATKTAVPRAVGTEVVGNKIVAVMQDPETGAITKTEIGDAPANLKPIPNTTSGGQPVFMGPSGPVDAKGKPVTSFDVKSKPVSATEQKEIFEVEDVINGGLSSVKTLEQALSLNPQAYEGSLSGWRKSVGQFFGSEDPQYVATENFDNIVGSGALRDLKTMFGANPTEGERKIYMELQAVSSKTRKVREDILRRALDAVKARVARETARLQRLKSGEYGSRGGSTVGGGRTIRYDRNGNRI